MSLGIFIKNLFILKSKNSDEVFKVHSKRDFFVKDFTSYARIVLCESLGEILILQRGSININFL